MECMQVESESSTTSTAVARTAERIQRAGRLREWLCCAALRLTICDFGTLRQKILSLQKAKATGGLRIEDWCTHLREIADILVRANVGQSSGQLAEWMLGFEDGLPAAYQQQWHEIVGRIIARRNGHTRPVVPSHCDASKRPIVELKMRPAKRLRTKTATSVIDLDPPEASDAVYVKLETKTATSVIDLDPPEASDAVYVKVETIGKLPEGGCSKSAPSQKSPEATMNRESPQAQHDCSNDIDDPVAKKTEEAARPTVMEWDLATGQIVPSSIDFVWLQERQNEPMVAGTGFATSPSLGSKVTEEAISIDGVEPSIKMPTTPEKQAESRIPPLLEELMARHKMRQSPNWRSPAVDVASAYGIGEPALNKRNQKSFERIELEQTLLPQPPKRAETPGLETLGAFPLASEAEQVLQDRTTNTEKKYMESDPEAGGAVPALLCSDSVNIGLPVHDDVTVHSDARQQPLQPKRRRTLVARKRCKAPASDNIRIRVLVAKEKHGQAFLQDVGTVQVRNMFLWHHAELFGEGAPCILARTRIDVPFVKCSGRRAVNRISMALYEGVEAVSGGEQRTFYLASTTDNMCKRQCGWCISPPKDIQDPRRFIQNLFDAFAGLMRLPSQAKVVTRAGLLFSPISFGPSGFSLRVCRDVGYPGDPMTDGCGRISDDLFRLAVRASRQSGCIRLAEEAFAIQVRIFHVFQHASIGEASWLFGKGVLRFDSDLPCRTVEIPKSMVKVPHDLKPPATGINLGMCDIPLGITKVCVGRPGNLTAMDMIIREANGVAAESMVQQVTEQTRFLAELDCQGLEKCYVTQRLCTMERQAKRQRKQSASACPKYLDRHWLSLNMALNSVHDRCTDSYIDKAAFLEKALRSPLPQSAMLVAVPDDTQTLNEGEIVVKTRVAGGDPTGGPAYVLGVVTASRYPEYHPANCRVLRAVAPSPGSALERQLEGRGEAAIFATLGERSELDCMGGGDYDGDEVLVVWHPSFIPPPVQAPRQPPIYEAAPALADTHEAEGDLGVMTANMLQRALSFKVGLLHHAWCLFAGRNVQDLNGEACADIDRMVNKELDSIKSGVHIEIADVDKVMNAHFGQSWRRLNYDFMALEKKHESRIAALPSATAVGQCAQVATTILREASSKIRADESGRDARLVAAWKRVQDDWPDEARTAVLAKYAEHRDAAKDVAFSDGGGRKPIRTRGGKLLRQTGSKKEEYADSPWISYIKRFRASLETTAGDRPAREMALLIYTLAPLEKTGSFPWCVVGDLLLEELQLQALSAGGVVVPADKLYLLQNDQAPGEISDAQLCEGVTRLVARTDLGSTSLHDFRRALERAFGMTSGALEGPQKVRVDRLVEAEVQRVLEAAPQPT